MMSIQNAKVQQVIAPQAIVDNDDPVGARGDTNPVSIDTLGYDYCSVLVQLGATDIAFAADIALYEGDVVASGADDSDFSAVSGATITAPDSDADGDNYWIHVDCRDKKRYFILEALCGNGTAGTFVTATAFLTRGNESHATDSTQRGITSEVFA